MIAALVAVIVATIPVRFEWTGGDAHCHPWVPFGERAASVALDGFNSTVDYLNYAKTCEGE